MRDGLSYRRERTFWQFVFPLDGVEERVRPLPGGGTETVRTEFGRDYLAQMVTNHFERMAAGSADGMAPQPVPLSRMHAIEAAIFGEEHAPLPFVSLTTRDLERLGGVLDLHLHEPPDEDADLSTPPVMVEGRPVPYGLWALCEWTGEGMYLAESGALPCLSPTTGPWAPTASATPFPGDTLIAIGLVDVPALDTIGCAVDRLPHDTFPTFATPMPEPEWVDWPVVEMMSERRCQMAQGRPVVMRRGSYALAPFAGVQTRAEGANETSEAAGTDAGGDSTTPDEGIEMNEDQIKELVAETVAGAMESLGERLDAMQSKIESMAMDGADDEPETSAAGEQPEDAQARSEGAGDTAPAEAGGAEPETRAADEAPADDVTARALRVEREALEAEALDRVKSRSLLAANVAQYIETRAKGGDVSDLLGDYGPSGPVGGNVVSDGGEVVSRGKQDAPKVVTEAELHARALANVDGNRARSFKEFKRLRDEARRDGFTINP